MIKIKELPLINVILHESLNETVFDVHPKKINIQTDNSTFPHDFEWKNIAQP